MNGSVSDMLNMINKIFVFYNKIPNFCLTILPVLYTVDIYNNKIL